MTAAKKILIIDDEAVFGRVLMAQLGQYGYEVVFLPSAYHAMEYLGSNQPDLILLDIMMPGLNGWEFLETFRGPANALPIPVIVLTALAGQEGRMQALRLGIDDYVAKPCDAEELAARVEAVLKRWERLALSAAQPVPVEEPADEDKKLAFLRLLKQQELPYLAPEYRTDVAGGYHYPLVKEFFQLLPGTEDEILSEMVTLGALRREFFDRILVCPACHHHDLAFRQADPLTGSLDITSITGIKHNRCGYIGPRSAFEGGHKPVCPACHRQLKAKDVDWEESDSLFQSPGGQPFTMPELRLECRRCHHEFLPGEAAAQVISAYLPGPNLDALLAGETTQAEPVKPVVSAPVADDHDRNLFMQRLEEEIIRSDQYRRNLALFKVEVANREQVRSEKGAKVVDQALHTLLEVLQNSLHPFEYTFIPRPGVFFCLLPEAGRTRLRELKLHLIERVEKELPHLWLDIQHKQAIYPKDGNTIESLLKKVE